MNLLFVCSRNRRRSTTAEAIFSTHDAHEALSAGTSPDAETLISADLIEWADIIFVMERVHGRKLNERFPQLMRVKKAVVLGIPDKYELMNPQLIELLKTKVSGHIEV